MSLKSFQYVRPDSVDKVVALLGVHGAAARLLAGGTDLLVRFRLGHVRPTIVIDLKRADGLGSDITEVGSSLRVGARVVMADIITDQRIRRHFPALVEAARVVGSVQIRHRATLAGNICNASPAADTAPALLVYGAVVNVIGPTGARSVPVVDFFTGPGQTVIACDEIVASIDLPIPGAPVGAAFGRLTRRRGVDLGTLIVCCLVTPSGETRIALGAVAPRPVLIQEDNTQVNRRTGPFAGDTMVDRAMAHTSPISDVRASREYRTAMLPVFIRRTLQIATDRLQRAQPHA
jgi:carbon-monoxide dehydrogenase medium subunit